MNATPLVDPALARFLRKALAGRPGPFAPLRALGAVSFQVKQARRRRELAAEGLVVPPVLIASVTRECNLECKGCYSRALRGDGPGSLPDGRFAELFEEAVSLGVGAILIAGGEPLLRRELLARAAAIPGPFMPVFTNGTLIDGAAMDLFAAGRLVPVLSIEGGAASTAARRGAGVHEDCVDAMDELARRGILFGASITLTSANAGEVLAEGFLSSLGEKGIAALFLVEYVPVSPGTAALALAADQRAELLRVVEREDLPFALVALPGDEEAYGGCLAAGRGFIHLADDGRIEACPFAPFSDTDAGATSLRAALGSPLMREIRARHDELKETKGGCALWNKGGWVSGLASCVRGAEPQTAEAALQEA